MNILSKAYHLLRERLSGDAYKTKLQAAVAKYNEVATTELPIVHLNTLGSDIESDLQTARREANKLLEKIVERSVAERRRLEIIFDSLDDAVLIAGHDGRIVDVSSKARQLFKLSTAELKEKTLADLFLKSNAETLKRESQKYFDYLQKIRCTFNCQDCDTECMATELHGMYANYVRTEHTVLNRPLFFDHRCLDGSIISVQIVLNILTLEVHNVEELNYVAVVRNLTADKYAKAETSKLQSFHANLMAITPIPVFYKDADLRFTSVSQSFTELLKLVESDLIGKNAEQVFESESAAELSHLYGAALSSGEQQSKTLDLKTLNGIAKVVNVFIRAIQLDGKNSMGIAGSVYPKLAADGKARAAFFNAVAKAIVFLDDKRQITGCNDEFVRLTGCPKTDIIGLTNADPRIAEFFVPMQLGLNSDEVTIRGTAINRLCLPLVHEFGNVEGLVYVFFTQFDKT